MPLPAASTTLAWTSCRAIPDLTNLAKVVCVENETWPCPAQPRLLPPNLQLASSPPSASRSANPNLRCSPTSLVLKQLLPVCPCHHGPTHAEGLHLGTEQTLGVCFELDELVRKGSCQHTHRNAGTNMLETSLGTLHNHKHFVSSAHNASFRHFKQTLRVLWASRTLSLTSVTLEGPPHIGSFCSMHRQ